MYNEKSMLVFIDPYYFLISEEAFLSIKNDFIAFQKIMDKKQFTTQTTARLKHIISYYIHRHYSLYQYV